MKGGTRRFWPGVPITFVVVGSALLVAEVDADWRRPHGDAHGTNRSPGAGRLRGELDLHPGFSEIVELERPELPASRLRDVTGDGVPDLLLPYRGRVAALDMTQGAFAWQSPVAGVDAVVDFADFDGDGVLELLAAARGVGGGLLTLDPETGAILSKTAPLPHRSGIAAEELAIADLDEDGSDDVVYPAAFFGLARVWAEGLGGAGGSSWALELEFSGYANLTPARVGHFAANEGPGLILDQGPTQRMFARCSSDSPEAACGGAMCLCPAGVFTDVHPGTYAFGQVFVADVEDDGVDEILTVADNPRYTRSLSAFSPAQALAAGEGPAGQLWYFDYTPGEATTLPLTPRETPVDLDGDGALELLVSFVDNLDDELDLAGAPADDGIDHAGMSVGVFDARTGELDASFYDAVAHGWIDLDDDGRPEVVVSPVVGDDWQAGLRAYEFGCAGGCLEPAWSTPHAFARASVRETYDREHLPSPTLLATRVGERDALLAYLDGQLELLRVDDGQLVTLASRALTDGQSVALVGEGFALLSDGRELQLVDAALASVGPPIPIPVQGTAPWSTARLDGFDAPIFEAKLYTEPLQDDASFAAPEQLLPHVALAHDLDGEGDDELVVFRKPEDELGSGFEIRALAWEQGQLHTRWSLVGDDEALLDGLELGAAMHFATGHFDADNGNGNGDGGEDLVFVAFDAAREALLVALDGDTGAVLHVAAGVATPASYTPLLIADLASPSGAPELDGVDDVLIDGYRDLELLSFGHAGPVWARDTSFYHAVGAQADVDGDGRRELIATTSNLLDNPAAALDFDSNLQPLWGPTMLGLPTGRTQVLSFANIDGGAGLDLVYITGEGGVELRNGETGAMLPGAPVFLADGELLAAPDPDAASLAALIVIDVDNDGHDEAIVGADDGWVYALNLVDEGTNSGPAIEWALEVGAGVSQIASGDVDADGFQELLVSTHAGQGIVLDSLGVMVEITGPDESCSEVGTIEVSGTAHGLAFVDLRLNGVLVDSVALDGPTWTAEVELPGPGEYELRAEGRDDQGELVGLSTTTITYGSDEDGDGVTPCAGDCNDNDPGTSPDALEICGDGIDQDCDGEDLPCDEGEGETGSFPGQPDWDPKARCNCSSSEVGARDAGRDLGGVSLLTLFVLGLRRRRRS